MVLSRPYDKIEKPHKVDISSFEILYYTYFESSNVWEGSTV